MEEMQNDFAWFDSHDQKLVDDDEPACIWN